MNIMISNAGIAQVIFCVCCATTSVASNRAFSIITAPKKVFPYSNYSVHVQVHDIHSPAQVALEVTCSPFNYSVAEEFENDGTRILSVLVGDIGNNGCSLQILGSGGLQTFWQDVKLEPVLDFHEIFLQMDKPIYKPGDVVRFRSIVVNQNLKPVPINSLGYVIQDPDGNIIKRFSELRPTKLISSHEFGLSDQPVLGNWTIHIDALVNATWKRLFRTFTVAEYVLPKFSVEIVTPKVVHASQDKIVISVRTSYTYGMPVARRVTLSIKEKTSSGKVRAGPIFIETIVGEADFEYKTADILEQSTSREYEVTARVLDLSSGITLSAITTFHIQENDYKVEMVRKLGKYISGFAYPLYVKILQQDDTPVEDDHAHVLALYQIQGEKREAIGILRQGIAKFVLNTTCDTVHNAIDTMVVHIDFKGKKYFIGSIEPERSTALLVHDELNKNPAMTYKVGQTINIRIASNHPVSEMFYIISKRREITHGKIEYIQNKTYYLKVEESMAPKFQFLVYDNTGAAACMTFNVDYDFENKISLNMYRDETVEPGSEVNIHINTTAKATVALLGMDQQMLLLKTGNDISKNDIEKVISKSADHDGVKSEALTPFDEAGVHYIDTRAPQPLVFAMLHSFSVTTHEYNMPDRFHPMRHFPMMEGGHERREPIIETHQDAQPIRLRNFFPETWLWEMRDADESGKLDLTRKVPDTITSWIISGISLSTETGLAISGHSKVKVFRQFFVKLNLPYSVIRGEVITINATIYNYFDERLRVVTKLENQNDEFEILQEGNTVAQENPSRKMVNVPANRGTTVSFTIKPKILGYLNIKVTAESNMAGDQILKKLLVKPEGVVHYFNKAMLITGSNFKEKVRIQIAEDAVSDSQIITATVVGNILGNSFNNLDNLVRMPSGCGEQNMINFVPNILVLDYVSRSNKLKPGMEAKALSHIEKGYQRQLTYKHNDGSFSVFGMSDGRGSTWLTAFVLKSFLQAKKYYEIDEQVLRKAVQFLMSQQQPDGTFVENGKMLSKTMQGLSMKSPAALTAYVVSAIAMHPKDVSYFDLTSSQDYLANYVKSTTDAYEIAIITYALVLSKSSHASTAIDKLSSLAIKSSRFIHWEYHNGSAESSIETTAYALMSYVLMERFVDATSIVRYLVSKQNSNGGFFSTQDTVVGLQALALFVSFLPGIDANMNVQLSVNGHNTYSLKVDDQNEMVLQKVTFPSETAVVNVESSGTGCAVVQVSWQYNVVRDVKSSSFGISHSPVQLKTNDVLQFTVQIRYLSTGSSCMLLVEVTLPSGYCADEKNFDKIKKHGAKRVETRDSKTTIVVYLDEVSSKGITFPITAKKKSKVEDYKPSSITVYDYYDKSKSATMFYNI